MAKIGCVLREDPITGYPPTYHGIPTQLRTGQRRGDGRDAVNP
jgi:hypothetical protein